MSSVFTRETKTTCLSCDRTFEAYNTGHRQCRAHAFCGSQGSGTYNDDTCLICQALVIAARKRSSPVEAKTFSYRLYYWVRGFGKNSKSRQKMGSESRCSPTGEGSHYASTEVAERMEELFAWAREQRSIQCNPHLLPPSVVSDLESSIESPPGSPSITLISLPPSPRPPIEEGWKSAVDSDISSIKSSVSEIMTTLLSLKDGLTKEQRDAGPSTSTREMEPRPRTRSRSPLRSPSRSPSPSPSETSTIGKLTPFDWRPVSNAETIYPNGSIMIQDMLYGPETIEIDMFSMPPRFRFRAGSVGYLETTKISKTVLSGKEAFNNFGNYVIAKNAPITQTHEVLTPYNRGFVVRTEKMQFSASVGQFLKESTENFFKDPKVPYDEANSPYLMIPESPLFLEIFPETFLAFAKAKKFTSAMASDQLELPIVKKLSEDKIREDYRCKLAFVDALTSYFTLETIHVIEPENQTAVATGTKCSLRPLQFILQAFLEARLALRKDALRDADKGQLSYRRLVGGNPFSALLFSRESVTKCLDSAASLHLTTPALLGEKKKQASGSKPKGKSQQKGKGKFPSQPIRTQQQSRPYTPAHQPTAQPSSHKRGPPVQQRTPQTTKPSPFKKNV